MTYGAQFLQGSNEVPGGYPAQVPNDAVVWEYPKLGRGEKHTEEPVVLFAAVVIRVISLSRHCCPCSTRTPVVSVCYIRNSDLAERFKQVGFLFYAPAGVHDAIICDKVKYWTLVHFFVNDSVDARMPDICEEDGAGVCIDTQNMIGPIVFLDLASVFVLLMRLLL